MIYFEFIKAKVEERKGKVAKFHKINNYERQFTNLTNHVSNKYSTSQYHFGSIKFPNKYIISQKSMEFELNVTQHQTIESKRKISPEIASRLTNSEVKSNFFNTLH